MEQWAQMGVSGLIWFVIPMTIGVAVVTRAEVESAAAGTSRRQAAVRHLAALGAGDLGVEVATTRSGRKRLQMRLDRGDV